MIFSSSRKFVIESDNINFIEDYITTLPSECIMHTRLMTRTIFAISSEPTRWLRIRAGDVDCKHNSLITASLIDKVTSKDANKKSIDLVLTDYYHAVSFFKHMGLKMESEQETKRTKYVCHFDDIKYTICFDIWPKLEKYTFVTITPATNADKEDLDGFVESTGVVNYSLDDFPTDIDQAYAQVIGKPARAFNLLRFE